METEAETMEEADLLPYSLVGYLACVPLAFLYSPGPIPKGGNSHSKPGPFTLASCQDNCKARDQVDLSDPSIETPSQVIIHFVKLVIKASLINKVNKHNL